MRANAPRDLSATLSNTARERGVGREERLKVLTVEHADIAPFHALEGYASGVVDPTLTLFERTHVSLELKHRETSDDGGGLS
jgi:hypothetical protein